jgi:hypothetical protein
MKRLSNITTTHLNSLQLSIIILRNGGIKDTQIRLQRFFIQLPTYSETLLSTRVLNDPLRSNLCNKKTIIQ